MSRIAARVVLVAALAASPALAATPPAQPKEGPGGSDYVGSEVAKRVLGDASGATFAFHAAGPAANPVRSSCSCTPGARSIRKATAG